MFKKVIDYVAERKPSPYLLEYVYSGYRAIVFMMAFSIVSLLLCISIEELHNDYSIVMSFTFITIIVGYIVYVIFIDRVVIIESRDKKKQRVAQVEAEVWTYMEEDVSAFGPRFVPNMIQVFYEPQIAAYRMLLYYRHPEQKVEDNYPLIFFHYIIDETGEVEGALTPERKDEATKRREPKTVDGKKLNFVRMVLTVPKARKLDEFLRIAPTARLQMVYWQKSKVLIEFRPASGVEYPPEALTLLDEINAMYP